MPPEMFLNLSLTSKGGMRPHCIAISLDSALERSDGKEIASLRQFKELVQNKEPSKIPMKGWVFQEIDFSQEDIEIWKKYNFGGTVFLGCKFPIGIRMEDLKNAGAQVFENPNNLPFKPFRGSMYRQEELIACDDIIYKFYKENHDVISVMNQSLHDYSMSDALGDYLEGKTVVSIMGGHNMRRTDADYKKVVLLAREISRKGFVIATGGGPGAMEAANLGSYLRNHPNDSLEEVLKLLAVNSEKYEKEFENIEAADSVLKKFGFPTNIPSLGIPTWYYGHEPSNRFATWQAKFFSNATREAGLISISNGGIIICPGQAGTLQEIFQAACRNHYGTTCCPMIFYGENFWTESGTMDIVKKMSKGRPYHELLLCTDDMEMVVNHLSRHQEKEGLPIITDEQLSVDLKKRKDVN